jgi:hypothetical protein
MWSTAEIVSLIKSDDITVTNKLKGVSKEDLLQIKARLQEPTKLSYTQRIMAKAFGISIESERQRFNRIFDQLLAT